MTFAQFGGTPREVRAEPTGFNNCDLDAEWCYFARQHFRKAFDTKFRRRIRPTSRRADPSAHRGKRKKGACLLFAKIPKSCLGHNDRSEEIRLNLCPKFR